MTRRLGTVFSQLISPLPPLCAPGPPKHSAAIYSHIHGIKHTHKEAYSSPDFPQTHLIRTVVVAAGGLHIDWKRACVPACVYLGITLASSGGGV